jgi:hypothetical protein
MPRTEEKTFDRSEPETNPWRPRDYLAAALLFAGTAAFVVWQNSRVAVLWDLGYLLDTSWRITLGQMPYRDFPLAHAPLAFLIQAGLMRLVGRHYFVQIAYAALAGGLATMLAWRIIFRIVRGPTFCRPGNWLTALLLAIPLSVVGIYSVYPHPIYDCDCTLAILFAILLLMCCDVRRESGIDAENAAGSSRQQPTFTATIPSCHPERSAAPRGPQRQVFVAGVRVRRGGEGSAIVFANGVLQNVRIAPLAAGAATVLPFFVKQNIGLPFLVVVGMGLFVLLGMDLVKTRSIRGAFQSQSALILSGMAAALLIAMEGLFATAGLGNYLHWTVQFAAQRRLPGLASMLAVYQQPTLLWTLPTLAVGLILCHTRFITQLWARISAFCLIAAPFVGSLIFLLMDDDADERADNLLALWPLLLIAVLVAALYELRRGLTLSRLIPFFVLAAIHGMLLSQQLWGSTYAQWPLLLVLVASLLSTLPAQGRGVAVAAAAAISATFLVCGGLYAASLERLSYIEIPQAPIAHSSLPALRGIAIPGPYLRNFDELAEFAAREIPPNEAVLPLPGEDPFFYATGRTPQFPVTLFDPATDPYSALGLVEEAGHRNIRWVIVKRVLQMNENPMPDRDRTMELLQSDFVIYRRLQGYDVYRRQ